MLLENTDTMVSEKNKNNIKTFEIGNYVNGNYKVFIYNDGTKIRETNEKNFISEFPENIDIKITNSCDLNCTMCHEDSSPDGKHGDILDAKFIDSLHPYTELAIGGGNPLAHPDIIPFLIKLKKKRIIANMTVNQIHFMKNLQLIEDMLKHKIIHGLGVSLMDASDYNFLNIISKYPNVVVHIINGMVSISDLEKMYDKNLKILILGYKQFRRGVLNFSKNGDSIQNNQKDLYDNLAEITRHFKIVSFDNLALKQLETKRIMSQDYWDTFYMGDDGQYTMYIDMVNKQYAKNSISTETYTLEDNIKDMFKKVKSL